MKRTVEVRLCSLVDAGTDCVVNTSNDSAKLGGGASRALFEECGGSVLQDEMTRELEEEFDGVLEEGDCLVTSAGMSTKFRHILHVPAVTYRGPKAVFGADGRPVRTVTSPERLVACRPPEQGWQLSRSVRTRRGASTGLGNRRGDPTPAFRAKRVAPTPAGTRSACDLRHREPRPRQERGLDHGSHGPPLLADDLRLQAPGADACGAQSRSVRAAPRRDPGAPSGLPVGRSRG
jgi:hypothetical protein